MMYVAKRNYCFTEAKSQQNIKSGYRASRVLAIYHES